MAQERTKIIKVMYSGRIEPISYPVGVKYEDILEIAIERFEIPADFKDFLQITDELGNVFKKNTFEYFLQLFLSPEMLFIIRVDYSEFIESTRPGTRRPLGRLNKRKRDQDEDRVYGVPVMRTYCFMGTLPPGFAEEPSAKKPKIDYNKSKAITKKKASSRKSFRI